MFTPKLDRPFQQYTDASTCCRACLAEMDDHAQERPTAFFSKKLTDALVHHKERSLWDD